jgi:hypothetical protein
MCVRANDMMAGSGFPNMTSLIEAVCEFQEQRSTESTSSLSASDSAVSSRSAVSTIEAPLLGKDSDFGSESGSPDFWHCNSTTASTAVSGLLHSASASMFMSSAPAVTDESLAISRQQTATQKPKAKRQKKKTKKMQDTANSNTASGMEGPSEEVIKLEEENRQLKDQRTCRVCMDVEMNTAFLPCGHLVCCRACARSIQKCPVCRARIIDTVQALF